MDEPFLSVRGLMQSFDGAQVLAGLDFDVDVRTITALIGPNGAGKTTAFRRISGTIAPERGRIVFAGKDITGWPAQRIRRQGVARTFQTPRTIAGLSVLENLMLDALSQPGWQIWATLIGFGRTAERRARERAIAIAERFDLLRRVNRPAGALSGGQKRLLEIGRALMAEPRLVLLDEPMAGANPTLAERIAGHLEDLRSEGLTFLVAAHRMDAIAGLCDPVIAIAGGRRLASGSFAEVAADSAVQEAFQGRPN
ncbi:MAG: ABC transporter ATP-binding protein [Acetobacteraceae bacterium]